MITGAVLRDAVISAANNISNNKDDVNALNVFPVPDGDTGTNMSMTITSAKKELELLPDDVSASKVASKTASAMLRGARGNSGVILSLIFRGISKGLKGLDTVTGKDMVLALSFGVESAYKAVMKPTEGTILTVVREATQAGAACGSENKEASFADIFDAVIAGAENALAKTPDLLPVLKKAGVVDAGGTGLVLCFKGMQSVFKEGKIIPEKGENQPAKAEAAGAAEPLSFAYCIEFAVVRNPSCKRDPLSMQAYFESIGNQLKIEVTDEIIAVHVHTNNPDKVIAEGLKYGGLYNINIKNMSKASCKTDVTKIDVHKYHSDVAVKETKTKVSAEKPKNAEVTKDVGFVAVAAGEGVSTLFTEIGADIVVSGGQTMNPSTADILEAVENVPAVSVFVLPNNKNIIMAAEQVDALSAKKVIVLPTRTIPQGITAMINYNPDQSVEANHLAMVKSLDGVDTVQVTFAARDSDIDGFNIKAGQMLGMENGKISVVENDAVTAAYKIVKRLCNRHTSTVTILYGEGASEEDAQKLEKMITDRYSNVETMVIDGGQPVYSFIISVE